MIISFDSIPACDRQTDRRTRHLSQALVITGICGHHWAVHTQLTCTYIYDD